MKIYSLLVVALLILFAFSTSVYAQYGTEWLEGDAKSKTDPLFIELVEEPYHMLPAKAIIHINDENIKKNAKFIEISTGQSKPYGLNGKEVIHKGGGAFRQTMKYNGEDKIEFGFRPIYYADEVSTITTNFYSIKEAPGNDWPDTNDEKSEFYRLSCHNEQSPLMCNKEEGCLICNKLWGSARRDFIIGHSIESITPPSRFNFVNKKLEYENAKGHYSGSTDHLYSAEKKITNNQGYETGQTETYSIKLTFRNNPNPIAEEKEFFSGSSIYGGAEGVDIGAPGGLAEGESFEIMSYAKPKPNNGIEWFSLKYALFSEMKPRGSGILQVEVDRKTVLPEGGSDTELETIKSEAKAYAASYQLTKQGAGKSNRELYHTYQVVNTGQVVEETTEDHIVVGSISDYFDHPLPYLQMGIKAKNQLFRSTTDKDGNFKVVLEGIDIKEDEEVPVKLLLALNYERDGKNYFDVYARKANNNYQIVEINAEDVLIGGEHLQIDLKLDDHTKVISNLDWPNELKHLGVIYYHTHEAVEFVLETLKEDMDYKLPVTVYVGNMNKKTLYSPSDSYILISDDDMSLSDSDRPDNREYHEFMHALQYDLYTRWPDGGRAQGDKNHDGFLNSNTVDSFIEGFAEFMALVISDEMDEPNPAIYADFGSMDQNYKVWDGNGRAEEFAVASLLWDMYDDINDKGDSLTMTFDEIWKIIKVDRGDFYDYYKAFKTEYPTKADAIDELFKEHGFFYDTRVGDGKYTPGEPWKYINERQRTYRFIDMSGNVSEIKYQEGFVIGKATNYNRSNRSSAVRIPNAFLKVKDDEVDFYNIKVSSSEYNYEYIVDRKGDLIYIQPLPTGSDATITITPKSNDYTWEKEFQITAKELNDALSPENELDGYIEEFEFGLKSKGTDTDEKYLDYDEIKPTYSYEGDLGGEHEEITEEEFEFGEFIGKSSGSSVWKTLIIWLIIIGLVVLYVWKPKFRNKANIFLVWVWKMIVKISKIIFHHSKEAYKKAKPHVKKAHQKIKKKIAEKRNKSKQKQGGK